MSNAREVKKMKKVLKILGEPSSTVPDVKGIMKVGKV